MAWEQPGCGASTVCGCVACWFSVYMAYEDGGKGWHIGMCTSHVSVEVDSRKLRWQLWNSRDIALLQRLAELSTCLHCSRSGLVRSFCLMWMDLDILAAALSMSLCFVVSSWT